MEKQTKTPEEIKLGMIDYMEDASCVTEYGDAHDLIDSVEKGHATMADALALIRQLEQDNAQKDERIRKLEREKEAMLRDMKMWPVCDTCKHRKVLCTQKPCSVCKNAGNGKTVMWEWIGVEEEER